MLSSPAICRTIVNRSLTGLGIAAMIIAASAAGRDARAQSTAQTASTSPARLSVRPHTMATGTRTDSAGEHTLDSLPGYLVYVCTKCVGTRRVPLVVILHGGGLDSRDQMNYMQEFAEQYNMIMLVPTATSPGEWDMIANYGGSSGAYPDVANIDAAMKQVLRKYAIDPDRIALAGMSDGGSYSLFLGRANLDIFSRIAPLSPGIYSNEPGPSNPSTQFFLAGGILEGGGFYQNPLGAGQELRQAGHPVKQVLMLRPHQQRSEDYAYMWSWLHDSWAEPNAAARPAPRAIADSSTRLTVDAVQRMMVFWGRFTQEPDSILTDARLAHLREFAVRAGEARLAVRMVDIPALAAQYPSVTADLERAGLTAAQEEAYRGALISAAATLAAGDIGGPVPPGSVLEENMHFMTTHRDIMNMLRATEMWSIP